MFNVILLLIEFLEGRCFGKPVFKKDKVVGLEVEWNWQKESV
jgi:hypothetical protein